MGQISYQIQLVNALYLTQNVLTNKQATDAVAGTLASDLLQTEFTDSQAVLQSDQNNIQALASESSGGWNSTEVSTYNTANQVYQNDAAIAQTGQANATTAVNAEQAQISQDGVNLSNFLSLSNTLMQIGNYMSRLLSTTYT